MRALKIILLSAIVTLAAAAAVFFYSRNHRGPVTSQMSAVSPLSHYSYFSQPGFFDDAYAAAAKLPTTTPSGNIAGILVNHHLLASSFIAQEFNLVATSVPLTVLLISPNHFDAGRADVITSAAQWQTPYGVLPPDGQLINQLTSHQSSSNSSGAWQATSGIASIEESPFGQEHGISGIVAFIKKSLPNAKVVPVIFNNRIKLQEAIDSADKYYAILPNNVLVVGSFDFSHYLPSHAADFHDIDNLAAVTNFDLAKIYALDIDSRPGLAFFLELLKDRGAQNFHLLQSSNSAKLTHRDILETTSYIDGYFTSGPAATSTVQTSLSLPVMPQITSHLQKNSPEYALTYMERFFYGQDVTIKGEKGCKGINGITVCQGAAQNRVEIKGGQITIDASGNLFDKTSLAVGVATQNHRTTIFLFPIGFDGKQVKLLIGQENDTVLAEMAKNSRVSAEIKTEIRNGVVTINN